GGGGRSRRTRARGARDRRSESPSPRRWPRPTIAAPPERDSGRMRRRRRLSARAEPVPSRRGAVREPARAPTPTRRSTASPAAGPTSSAPAATASRSGSPPPWARGPAGGRGPGPRGRPPAAGGPPAPPPPRRPAQRDPAGLRPARPSPLRTCAAWRGRSAMTAEIAAASIRDFQEVFGAVRREIARVVVGHDDVIDAILAGLLAGGHVLIEGVP